jgi:hypothetical protein
MHLQNNVLWQTRDALRIKEEGCLFLGLRVMEPSARAQSPYNKVMFMDQLRFGLFSFFGAILESISLNPRKDFQGWTLFMKQNLRFGPVWTNWAVWSSRI